MICLFKNVFLNEAGTGFITAKRNIRNVILRLKVTKHGTVRQLIRFMVQ